MSKILSFFSPPKQERQAPSSITASVAEGIPKKSKKAALLALRATSAGGVLDEVNIGRKKILV